MLITYPNILSKMGVSSLSSSLRARIQSLSEQSYFFMMITYELVVTP